jgi:hypothetical protein
LLAIEKFPRRVGMIKLPDLSGQIEVQCFSAEWCKALGFLWPREAGEPAFKAMPSLVGKGMYMDGTGATFRHRPLLRSHGYTGSERAGALEIPGIVEKFYTQGVQMEEWLLHNVGAMRARLTKAAYE